MVEHKIPKAEQDWVYLIHHTHPPKKETEMETLHHCFLFDKKGLKGNKFSQIHVKDGRVFQHVLDIKELDDIPEIVYDHLNNGFKIKVIEINKKKQAVILGPERLKDIRWSAQDRKPSVGEIKSKINKNMAKPAYWNREDSSHKLVFQEVMRLNKELVGDK